MLSFLIPHPTLGWSLYLVRQKPNISAQMKHKYTHVRVCTHTHLLTQCIVSLFNYILLIFNEINSKAFSLT